MNPLEWLRRVVAKQHPPEDRVRQIEHAEALDHAARALRKVPGMTGAVAEIRRLEQSARRGT